MLPLGGRATKLAAEAARDRFIYVIQLVCLRDKNFRNMQRKRKVKVQAKRWGQKKVTVCVEKLLICGLNPFVFPFVRLEAAGVEFKKSTL